MKHSPVKPAIALIEAISPQAQAVRDALVELNLENPMLANKSANNEEKRLAIVAAMESVMDALGLDRRDDSLCETPTRIAKMFVDEIFSGLDYHNFPKVTVIENKMGMNETISVSNINVTSTCEHHFVTIDGVAKVAYRPNKKIIGLSKINRIVKFFSQRPQVQERLTQQILVALQVLLETKDVAVKIDACHYCVKARGVRDTTSRTSTLALGGKFKKKKFRQEFCLD